MSGLDIKLSPGIHAIEGEEIRAFPDYTEEIKTFEKAKEKNIVPFVNQNNAFLETVRTLTTEYPYAVLVGESGIGKSLVLEHIVDIITEKIPSEKVQELHPDVAPLFEEIKRKAKKFENRRYLFLPNLQNPTNVVSISYTDKESVSTDFDIADRFSTETTGLIENYAIFNRAEIKRRMSATQFDKFSKVQINELYTRLHNKIEVLLNGKKTNAKTEDRRALDELVINVRLKLPKDIYSDRISGDCNILYTDKSKIPLELFREEAGYTLERDTITQKIIEEGLGHTLIPRYIANEFNKLAFHISVIDVDGLSSKQIEQRFKKIFEEYTNEVIPQIEQKYRGAKLRNQQKVVSFFNNAIKPYTPPVDISKKSVDLLLQNFKEVFDSYYAEDGTPELKDWLTSVYQYFATDRRKLEESLKDMLEEIEEIEKNPEIQLYKSHLFNETYSNIKFKFTHAGVDIALSEVLDPNYIESIESEHINWTKIDAVNRKTLFATFTDKEESYPPHMQINHLGNFFQSSILVFNDSFSDFIKTITQSNEKVDSLREKFLEYLQTGTMTLVNEGITYKLHAPKIILACDNEDPFITTQGFEYHNEAGLRSRIKTIRVNDITDNTPEVRKGTLQVMYKTIDTFNKQNNKHVTIDTAAANMLLQTMIYSEDLALLEYRDFTKRIEDICAYTVSTGKQDITEKSLKDKIREEIYPGFFSYIDYEKNQGGYFDLPDDLVGHVNGLSVFNSMQPGNIVKVRSYFLPGIDNSEVKRFEQIDVNTKLSDETTSKGYTLAADFVQILIQQSGITDGVLSKTNWQLKTHFGEGWSHIGGPSASFATAISMVSALTDKPIYKNRFVTGTIDPADGLIGPIGGAYGKGLIPLRLQEIAQQQGIKGITDNMYFLCPASNMKQLTQDLIFDPFGMREKITIVPITHFAEAFYLMTCGPEITTTHRNESRKYNREKLLTDISSQIKTRFKV